MQTYLCSMAGPHMVSSWIQQNLMKITYGVLRGCEQEFERPFSVADVHAHY